MPNLQMGTLRHYEGKWPIQGHRAGWDSAGRVLRPWVYPLVPSPPLHAASLSTHKYTHTSRLCPNTGQPQTVLKRPGGEQVTQTRTPTHSHTKQ